MQKNIIPIALAALTAALVQTGSGQAPPATRPAADVPVKEVVLYSSGVGYFEHFGTVQGDGSTELRFKTNQINDILKSLVLQDLDGGQVSAVTYPSQDPIAKTLKSFQVDITANPPLATLLNQLRGAKVTLSINGEKFSGVILGVETKKKAVGDKGDTVDQSVLNLVSGGKILSQPLDSVSCRWSAGDRSPSWRICTNRFTSPGPRWNRNYSRVCAPKPMREESHPFQKCVKKKQWVSSLQPSRVGFSRC